MKYAILVALISCSLISCKTRSVDHDLIRGNEYAKDGLYREAIHSYKLSLKSRKSNYTTHRNLGMVYVKTGDYEEAVKHLEKAIKRYDDNFEANFYLAEAYRAQDKYAEAIFRYQKADRQKPKKRKVLKALAWSFFKIRYYSEALSTAKSLLEIYPDDGQTAIIVARTYLKLKNPTTALRMLKQAKRKVGKKDWPYFDSVEGDILLSLQQVDKADVAFSRALKDRPLLAGALFGKGQCYYQKGELKKAIKYMERAVRVRPRLTEAHYYLGKSYEKIDRQKSLKYYSYFKRQAAKDPEYIERLLEVKKRVSLLQNPAVKALN